MESPQKGYTLVKHDSDNLYDLTIFDNNRIVQTVKSIPIQKAVVIIEDATYAKSYQP